MPKKAQKDLLIAELAELGIEKKPSFFTGKTLQEALGRCEKRLLRAKKAVPVKDLRTVHKGE
ncbi:hypothetical protein [Roseibium alexandrii]|uniref:hypothetical protein n=1 Tax=Roseibium alexandrii TaxID=388408 RepID=UPI003751EAB6